MTLNELISTALALKEENPELGDKDVYVYADHGQTTEPARIIYSAYAIDNDSYYVETIHPDDVNDYDQDELIQIIEISS